MDKANLSKVMLQPQRLPNEEFKDYKFRRTFANWAVKQKMKGIMFFKSLNKEDLGTKKNVPYQNLEKQQRRTGVPLPN